MIKVKLIPGKLYEIMPIVVLGHGAFFDYIDDMVECRAQVPKDQPIIVMYVNPERYYTGYANVLYKDKVIAVEVDDLDEI